MDAQSSEMPSSVNSTPSRQKEPFQMNTASFSFGDSPNLFSSAESLTAEESGPDGRRMPVGCDSIRDDTRSPKTPTPVRLRLPNQPRSEPTTQTNVGFPTLQIPKSRGASDGTDSSQSTQSSPRKKTSPCTKRDSDIPEFNIDQSSATNETNIDKSPSPPSRQKTRGSTQIDEDSEIKLMNNIWQSSDYDESGKSEKEGTRSMAQNSPPTLHHETISLDDSPPPFSLSNSNVISENPAKPTETIQFHKTHEEDLALRDISSRIFKCIQRAAVFGDKRMEDGYIYVMRMKDSKYHDYVKIGRTTKIHERRSQIEHACGYQLDAVDDACFTKVSCHPRLEAIIQLELRNQRLHFTCLCKGKAKKKKDKTMDAHVKDDFTTHGEWFKIDYREALDRVQKWRGWMEREPYELSGILAPEWEEHIEYLNRKTNYAEVLRKEQESDQLWKSFMKTSGLPWIDPFFLAARRGPDGRRTASRWNSVRANWRNLILFFLAQCLVMQSLKWAGTEWSNKHRCIYGFLGFMNLYWL